MRKIVKLGICTMAAAMLLAGCSAKEKTTETTVSTPSDSVAAAGTEEYVAESSVKLGEYKGLKINVQKATATQEEIDARIQQDLNVNAEYPEVDRAAKEGDTVNIDYKGLLDGTAFEGGTAEKYDLVLGSGNFIEGFEEQLIGVKKGDKKDLNLTFPEVYSNTELAGKAVVFEVTVNAVKEKKVPELNEEFITKAFPDKKDVETYKKSVEEEILLQKNDAIESQKTYDIIEAVMAGSEVICSTDAIEKEYQAQLKSFTQEAEVYGMDLASMASMYGTDEEGFKIQIRMMASDYATQKLLFAEIAKKENLTVTDEDLNELALSIGFEDKNALIAQYSEEEVNEVALAQKVMDFLVANAEVTEVDAAAQETKAE